MKRQKKQGILVDGSLRTAGVTFFTRNGQTIVRSSTSRQPRRLTAQQLEWRQRLAHNTHLWGVMIPVSQSLISRGQFFVLAASLPPVYLTRAAHSACTTLLLPGIPVACGTLPEVRPELGTVDGTPALLFEPTVADSLRLVTLRQEYSNGVPRLTASAERVKAGTIVAVGGRWALVGAAFGDSACGWSLVQQQEGRCSTARLVTASTAYRAYQTPEARAAAAASYGYRQ